MIIVIIKIIIVERGRRPVERNAGHLFVKQEHRRG
jgi:hypothetical protein